MQALLRTIRPGEEHELLRLLTDAHGDHHDPAENRRILSSQRFDPGGCFIAEENGLPTGCVAVTRLPRSKWFVVRYLAARDAGSRVEVVDRLLEKAVQHAKSQNTEYVRATTPALKPYVEAYRRAGFNPLRKDFRIVWDLDNEEYGTSEFEIEELKPEMIGQAAEAYVESLRPFWDWRTEEYGGPSAMARSFEEGVRLGVKWVTCQVDGRPVGFAGLIPDYYGNQRARFRGASVLPAYRARGIGSALMREIIPLAKSLGQRKMTVYTFSYLDRLAPGAAFYLRSGGWIEAEYLQLQLRVD